MAHSAKAQTQRASFRLALLSFTNRILLWILSKFTSKAGKSPLWRISLRLLLSEMQTRQWRGPLSAKPYIEFERYFANNPDHLLRFQNFVAGNRILVDLLAANWFEFLPVKDHAPVTALFRRIYQTENVWLSYRNRPAIMERMRTLEYLEPDSQQYFEQNFLPESDLIAPKQSINGAMAIGLKTKEFFNSIGAVLGATFKACLRGADFFVSYLTISLVSIPLSLS